MGRKPAATAPAAEATETAGEAKAPIRRRRRRTVIDHVGQTKVLVESLMRARGGEGASGADALTVATWARGVHEEAAALKILTARVRKAKAEGVAERLVALDVNKALLDGVLSGELLIDVKAGNVCFRDGRDPIPFSE